MNAVNERSRAEYEFYARRNDQEGLTVEQRAALSMHQAERLHAEKVRFYEEDVDDCKTRFYIQKVMIPGEMPRKRYIFENGAIWDTERGRIQGALDPHKQPSEYDRHMRAYIEVKRRKMHDLKRSYETDYYELRSRLREALEHGYATQSIRERMEALKDTKEIIDLKQAEYDRLTAPDREVRAEDAWYYQAEFEKNRDQAGELLKEVDGLEDARPAPKRKIVAG